LRDVPSSATRWLSHHRRRSNAVAAPLAALEPLRDAYPDWSLLILPLLGAQLGVDLRVVSQPIANATDSIIGVILQLTGNM
jgi:hypothetical protein